jgi:isopentenyl phosphate kinase
MGSPSAVTLVKLGGSLLTDKTAVDAVRPDVLARLAAEIAAAAPAAAGREGAQDAGDALVIGHGSGSFGHVAASRYGLAAGLRDAGQLPGVSRTQERAAALHRQVCAALAAAGLFPFSLAPSSSVVAAGGRPLAIAVEPLVLALGNGLLPVLYGDVVLDREQGVAICSTERLFELLAAQLPAFGMRVRRVLWLGETDGVYDAAGRTLPRLGADALAGEAGDRPAIGAAAGTDVTGGMLHRVETALALAARGIPSLIANGTTPGLLAAALRGEPVVGTEVGG